MRVPGIGTRCASWCSSQASASCAGVSPSSSARPRSGAKRSRLAARFSGAKRGALRRKSSPARADRSTPPARKPSPSGAQATKPTPSSRRTGSSSRLRGARPQAVLDLDRRERVGLVGGQDLLGGGVAEPEVADLALRDELGHRAEGLLDRHAGSGKCRYQRSIASTPRRRRLASAASRARSGRASTQISWSCRRDPAGRAAGRADDAPLRRELDLVAAVGDRAADERLVGAVGAVGVGGVEKVAPASIAWRSVAQRALVVGVRRTCRRRAPSRRSRWRRWSGRSGSCSACRRWSPPAVASTGPGSGDRFRRWPSSASCATSSRSPSAAASRGGARAAPLAAGAERGDPQARGRARRRAARSARAAAWRRQRRARRSRRGARGDRALRRRAPRDAARPDRTPAGRLRGGGRRPARARSPRPLRSPAIPHVRVEPRPSSGAARSPALREGECDLAFVWLPADMTGLHAEIVASEPRYAGLALGHPLAGREGRPIGELADEPIMWTRRAPRHWVDWWAVNPRPDGRAASGGRRTSTSRRCSSRSPAGSRYASCPSSMTEFYGRPDIVWVPIADIPPLRIALAWRDADAVAPASRRSRGSCASWPPRAPASGGGRR